MAKRKPKPLFTSFEDRMFFRPSRPLTDEEEQDIARFFEYGERFVERVAHDMDQIKDQIVADVYLQPLQSNVQDSTRENQRPRPVNVNLMLK